MAGLGRKVWTNEVLSQPDLQGYLQDQVVAVFANAAARSAAIPAPSEGMHTYQLDVHRPEVYNGTAWIPAQYGQVRGKMWRTAGFSGAMTTGTAYTIPMQSARLSGGFTWGGGDTSAGASSYLTLPFDGLYDLDMQGYASGGYTGQGTVQVVRQRASVADVVVAVAHYGKTTTTQDITDPSHVAALPLKAADKLILQMVQNTNSGGTATYYGGSEPLGCNLAATYAGPLAGATAL